MNERTRTCTCIEYDDLCMSLNGHPISPFLFYACMYACVYGLRASVQAWKTVVVMMIMIMLC